MEDLRATDHSGGRREDYEIELKEVDEKITEKKALLDGLLPEWEDQRALEITEKRRLDEASASLNALYAKQGRASKFRTKSDRDAFLRQEIVSVTAYQKNQATALETAQADLESSRQSQNEVDELIKDVQGKLEDGKRRTKEVQENIVALKEQQAEMAEKRRDLWREDTKLDSLVSHAADELRTAERSLAGMMDKVRVLVNIKIYS